MYRYEFTEKFSDGVVTYRRVSHREAMKRFLNGENITFTPCNTSPASPVYRFAISMNKSRKDSDCSDLEYWQKLKNSYEWYNCNSELGRYIAYYTEEWREND